MSKSLREAAEAVVRDCERFGDHRSCSHRVVIGYLRSALSEPDPLTEAVEIIERLLNPAEARWEQYDMLDCADAVRARDFLARMKGGGE